MVEISLFFDSASCRGPVGRCRSTMEVIGRVLFTDPETTLIILGFVTTFVTWLLFSQTGFSNLQLGTQVKLSKFLVFQRRLLRSSWLVFVL